MSFAAVLVAGGAGLRAGGDVPKQWRDLAGRPVLRWAAEGLLAAGAARLVVVVPAGDERRGEAALSGLPNVSCVGGGPTRTDSVRNGLAALPSDAEAVLVHDAARPFVSPRHVAPLIAALAEADGALPALAVGDTLKQAERDGAVAGTVPRAGLFRAQTPQAFRLPVLTAAYASATGEATDDAALVEAAGGRVVLTPGDPLLFKITHPEDFAMAEAVAGAARVIAVGQGFDAHRFGPGDRVWLCGVEIPHEAGLIGHSDADAGLHALTDAVLGAAGEGDIGDWFPPDDPRWKGARSDQFLRHAVERVTARGGRLVNVDVTLICETPRVKPYREAMRARVSEILGLPLARVSVKATTTEKMGFTGRREGLAAQAVASVELPA
ncbi:MAG TPA: bifunctional 2-C-methyl-D-erythritol 4-phosphate cytidylyltransferase/2-C-methyl-D-erythritol 2,4-cyclodiphosphate synthase [Caulobacteraceae bacterium]|jgi:2-C-methyl-D-erythritol 4-phosphate cytidylyltransferase/2-C-methyl-D-erythritol 2,4-cyclodiphosphate synthase